jgi:soluble lytic murein transglycosylase
VRKALVLLVVLGFWLPAAGAAAQEDEEKEKEKERERDREDGAGDEVAAAPTARPRPHAARPVRFDRDWLEPFFKNKPARQAAEAFRQSDWDAAEAGFAKAVKALPRSSSERQAATYLLATAKMHQSKWAEAGKLFEGLAKSYPRLGPYHAYQAARCRLRRGDSTGALEWASRVPRGTVPEAEANLVRIEGLRVLGRWEEVLTAAQDHLDRFPGGPRRAEAQFRKGEAMEKLAAKAPAGSTDITADVTALYRRVWAEAPLETWSERAAERIKALAQTLPPEEATLVRTYVAGEWFTRGMVLFDRNRSADSEAAFASSLAAPGLDRDIECRARFHRAQSVWKQGSKQRPRAAPMFDEAEAACFRSGNRDLHAKALYQGARCQSYMGAKEGALARYARIEKEHSDHSYADDARVRSAEVVTDAGDEAAAIKLLSEVPARYPKGDLLNEALWRLAFTAWRASRYDEAMRWLDENLRLVPREEIWYAEGRVQYWKARVFEKQAKPEDARVWYERAVREYPLSVYALLALSRLRESAPKTRTVLLNELRQRPKKPTAWSFAARPLFGEPGFLRAVELARMGQGTDARRELGKLGLSTSGDKRAVNRPSSDEEDLLWMAAVLLDRGEVWSASHSIPRHTLTSYRQSYPKDLGHAKWKLAYPRAFRALVTKNARANQIPEALQLAIMREESAFNPRIESIANAVGLTQMLVKTAKRFANKGVVSRESLMDPAKNLECGSRFLSFLLTHFRGSAPLAVAGYNAGEGAVDRWLGERSHLALDEFLETIPYDETRNYTKRVLASYFTYSWLYSDHTPVPEIPLTLPGQGQAPRAPDKRG